MCIGIQSLLRERKSTVLTISLLWVGVIFVIFGHYLNEISASKERQFLYIAMGIQKVLWPIIHVDNKSTFLHDSSIVHAADGREIDEIITHINLLIRDRDLAGVIWPAGADKKLLLLQGYLQHIKNGVSQTPPPVYKIDPQIVKNIRELYGWIINHAELIASRKKITMLVIEGGVMLVILIVSFVIIFSNKKQSKEEGGVSDLLKEEVDLRTMDLDDALRKNKDQLESLLRTNARLVILNSSLERLQDASKYFKFGENSSTFMGRAVRDVMGLTDAQYGFMALISEESVIKDVFTVGFSENFSTRLMGSSSTKGVFHLIIGETGLVHIDNLARYSEALSGHEECRDMRNMLGISIVVRGVVQAVICLFDKKNGLEFDGDDEAMLGLFAIDLSHAMERLAMLEELHRRNEELEAEKEMQKRLIDKLQQAQTQLLQTEKMASIGQLAAGVAHEINNPVGYISSNLNSLKRYLDDLFKLLDVYACYVSRFARADDADFHHIRELEEKIDPKFLKKDLIDLTHESMEGADRVIKIVRDLKEFSHVDQTEFEIADLHKGLDSTLNIAHNEIKYKAEVIKEYSVLPAVECVPAQINQVFMNIIVNAAHAIEEKGTIWVKTGVIDDRVWIEISDTGKGISPENLSKIYDPFFTTKPVGKGTGLGLSITYGIIAKHNGKIEVESKVGVGTRFRIWLPVRHVTTEDESSLAISMAPFVGET